MSLTVKDVNAPKKQTANDCIETYLESLAGQVHSNKDCLRPGESIDKQVKFFGIAVSISPLNLEGLTDFIKAHKKSNEKGGMGKRAKNVLGVVDCCVGEEKEGECERCRGVGHEEQECCFKESACFRCKKKGSGANRCAEGEKRDE